MKKLSLDLDALKVQSFSPEDDAENARGTVQGQEDTVNPYPEEEDDSIIQDGGTYFRCDTSCGLYYCDTNQSCDGGFTVIRL